MKGNPKHSGGLKPYQDYLRFLLTKYPPFSEENSIEIPYLDYLQAPLQVTPVGVSLIIVAIDG